MSNIRNVKKSSRIEDSPLLSKSNNRNEPVHSTVHADRFDMSRFSERKDNDDENSFKIIIYVVVVIIIGVGLALLVRALILNNSESTQKEDNTEQDIKEDQPEVIKSPAISINTTMRLDPSDAPANDDLIDALSLSIGNSNANVENASISNLDYSRYNSFVRINFGIEGISKQEELPKIAINYNSDESSLDIVFPSEININQELKEKIEIDDVVSDITYSSNTNTFTISVSSEFKYLVVPTTAGMLVDIKTIQQIERKEDANDEETPLSETEEDLEKEQDPTTSSPSLRGNVNLDNEFSANRQSVSGGVTNNTIILSETYFEDQGEYFELAWGQPRVVGEEFTPTTSAELISGSNTPILKLTINNLERFEFESSGISQDNSPINLAGTNFVRADLISFENGTAVVEIQLKNEAEFKLISTTTVSGLTQVLAIQIKD